MSNKEEMNVQKVGSYHFEVDKDVREIFQSIDLEQRRRIQENAQTQLAVIHDRVKKALAHYGINTNILATPSEIAMEELRQRRPPGFNTKQKREEMLHKRTILDTIHEYGQTCLRREMLIDEFSDWMYDVQTTVEKIIVSDEEIIKKNNEVTLMERSIIVAVNDHKKHVKKIVEKFKVLSREMFETMNELATMEHEEVEPETVDLTEAVSATTRRRNAVRSRAKDNKDPLNEKALMADAANWKAASVEVKKALEEAGRMAKTNNDRNMCRNALKQFNFMCVAMERRNQENCVLSQNILELEVNVNHLNKATERADEELKKKTLRLESMEKFTEKQNQKIAELKQKLKELKESYEKVLAALKKAQEKEKQLLNEGEKANDQKDKKAAEELRIFEDRMSQIIATMTKEIEELRAVIQEHEDTIEKLKVVIENLERQLDNALDKQHEYEKQLNITVQDTEAKNSRQESLREQYTQRINDYRAEIDKLEEDIRKLQSELQTKVDMISVLELKVTELTAELKKRSVAAALPSPIETAAAPNSPTDYRHMVSRIKAEYELEIHKLQDHLSKEKQRCDATLRKQEQDMKVQLAGIHRVSLHLLRAINHFKDSLVNIFEKEGLLDLAHEVKLQHNLPVDEKPTDTKIKLNMMSGNALELLVSLEIKISQALMNKRIELKEALAPKRGSSPAHDGTADEEKERLRKENIQANEKVNKEEKYKALLDRHKQLILHSSGIQREMRSLQADFQKELKQRDSKLRSMRGNLAEQERNKQMLVMQMESNKAMPSQAVKKEDISALKLKVEDQFKNLKMLGDALKENKISLELHTITVDVITQAMEVPEMRLRQLFERYITFRKLQDQKEQLMNKLSMTTGEQERYLQGFLTRMEKRMQESIKKWQEKKEQLKVQRTKLYEQMFAIFDAVKEETGLSMIKPITKTLIFIKPQQQRRDHGRTMGPYGVHLKIPDKPSNVIGTSVALIGSRGPVWKPIGNIDHFPAYITTPRTLDLDVNYRRQRAREVLKRLGMGDFTKENPSRQPSRMSQSPSVPPLATLFPPITNFKK
ncbi:probable DNA double-strand break repair Rad50 ATPase isoform X2 [Anneissia japonica]|uniref:probable DNA double-strand break repair Rad50 ATPase isoform X2 n=1 Tax=Anneissia japonica TaxID=1529436 RepID=UPI001425A44A|nr:probable DNA double-strand break repair Rad50 ATPase isoform X2 [Anneissia japonica]